MRRWDDGAIRQRDVESAGSSLAAPFGPQTLFTFSEWKIGGAEDSASRDLAGNKHHGLMPTTLASARKRCDSSAGVRLSHLVSNTKMARATPGEVPLGPKGGMRCTHCCLLPMCRVTLVAAAGFFG